MGAAAKLRRGEAHFQALDALVDNFRTEAYSVQFESDFPKSGQTIVFAEPLQEPPAVEWGPMIGDCAHGLWAIDPDLTAPIKKLQPFCTGQQAPEREPLAMLHELSNIDKHAHPQLVNATVELADVISVRPFEGAPDITFNVVWQRAPGPLKERTEIARVEQVGLPITNMPEMHMDARFRPDIAFSEGHPAHGGRLLQTLSGMGQTVQSIIAALT